MKRSLIILVLFGLALGIQAQETYYYNLIKIVKENRTSVPRTASWIFVTFTQRICYDSDSEGYYSNNGKLTYFGESDEALMYKGYCYFGNAAYLVSKSKKLINIYASDGTVYVYVRGTPKSNVKESSYGDIVSRYAKSSPDAGGEIFFNSGIMGSGNDSEMRKSGHGQPIRETCPSCNGTKVGFNEQKDVPSYTGDYSRRWCGECGTYGYAHVHVHHPCGRCGGKGYIERY